LYVKANRVTHSALGHSSDDLSERPSNFQAICSLPRMQVAWFFITNN
jgi:hypothetical protein